MNIPKIINKNNHAYVFVKEYPDHVLYKSIYGYNECFVRHELGLIKEMLAKSKNIRLISKF